MNTRVSIVRWRVRDAILFGALCAFGSGLMFTLSYKAGAWLVPTLLFLVLAGGTIFYTLFHFPGGAIHQFVAAGANAMAALGMLLAGGALLPSPAVPVESLRAILAAGGLVCFGVFLAGFELLLREAAPMLRPRYAS